jgi:hypothetical protein
MSSGSNSYDATGHLVRATPIITEQALVGLPPQVHEAARTLMQAGLLQKTRQIGYDPYPLPNSIGTNPDGEGVLGPTQVTKKYPRLHADC